jgi:CheY-like chemotaxis protein
VRLTVSDTGCGMDAATRQRVFEPFFTTKAPGEGTGLGLSVVHGIVRSHRGAIRLRSEAGRGTTFEIYLPTIVAQPLPDSEKPDEIPCGHGERILFVDDEMLLVRLGERILRQSGYAVEGEDRALAALARLEREPQAFQLIVTDQTMPGLTGLEFARRVQALRANLPVVLMSGYSLALTPEQIRESGVREVLTKPYTAATLAAAVRRHLPDNPPPDHAPHTADR